MIRAALLFIAVAAAPAGAYTLADRPVVEPGPGRSFIVPFTDQAGVSWFWCAAADHARRNLGAARSDRIWRLSAPPRRGGEGIRFSLSPDGAAGTTGLVMLGPDDGAISVAHGLAICAAIRGFED